MQYPAVVAHVYSSGQGYADRTSRTLGPFHASSAVGPLTVSMGAPPRWLFRARERLYRIRPMQGGSLAAWLSADGPDPRVRLRPRSLDRAWYTSLILDVGLVSLDVTVTDGALAHEQLVREAAVLLASESSAHIIERLELSGIFLQRGDGEWVKLPRFELFPPSVYVEQTEDTLRRDVIAAEALLGSLQIESTDVVSRRIDWAMRALLASEPWSQFIWFMFSLERLAEDVYRSMSGDQRQRVRPDAEGYLRLAGAGVPNEVEGPVRHGEVRDRVRSSVSGDRSRGYHELPSRQETAR